MTLSQKILALMFSIFGLIACSHSSRENKSEIKPSAIENLKDSLTIPSVIDNDVISYDNASFPVDSAFLNKVLTVGTFHGDEVSNNVNRGNWFGLFYSKAGFYIAKTELKTKRVHDGIIDVNENEKTGWEIQTSNEDSSIILIEDLNLLKPHDVKRVVLSKEEIFPGDTLSINHLGLNYKIVATGKKKKVQDYPELYEVWNYKLYLTATIKGQERKSLLVAQPNFDDKMIKLIFAGDIDGDGILDLIIDTSRHYNVISPTLYLSIPAGHGEVVKPTGRHTSVGC